MPIEDRILCAGPWVRGTGEQPSRIVMHAWLFTAGKDEYIVHMQYADDEGRKHYHNGDYRQDYQSAMVAFGERCIKHYTLDRKLILSDEVLALNGGTA